MVARYMPCGRPLTVTRPWCCPEPECTPILSSCQQDPQPETGVSFICFGYLKKPIPFTYAGRPHRNDVTGCWYSPLKGMIRWQETVEDWWRTVEDYQEAMRRLPLTVIARCGRETRDFVLSLRPAEVDESEAAEPEGGE